MTRAHDELAGQQVKRDDEGAIDDQRLAEWHRYYSAKRIGQQWFQVHLLEDLPVRRVLEVGPYLGLVTAMLDNAGYEVATLDLLPRGFERPERPHTIADLLTIDPVAITGFDAILCCETLEHLGWNDVDRVLAAFRRSGAKQPHRDGMVRIASHERGCSHPACPCSFSVPRVSERQAANSEQHAWQVR